MNIVKRKEIIDYMTYILCLHGHEMSARFKVILQPQIPEHEK